MCGLINSISIFRVVTVNKVCKSEFSSPFCVTLGNSLTRQRGRLDGYFPHPFVRSAVIGFWVSMAFQKSDDIFSFGKNIFFWENVCGKCLLITFPETVTGDRITDLANN